MIYFLEYFIIGILVIAFYKINSAFSFARAKGKVARAISNNYNLIIEYKEKDENIYKTEIKDLYWANDRGLEIKRHSDFVNAFSQLRKERKTFRINKMLSIDGINYHFNNLFYFFILLLLTIILVIIVNNNAHNVIGQFFVLLLSAFITYNYLEQDAIMLGIISCIFFGIYAMFQELNTQGTIDYCFIVFYAFLILYHIIMYYVELFKYGVK